MVHTGSARSNTELTIPRAVTAIHIPVQRTASGTKSLTLAICLSAATSVRHLAFAGKMPCFPGLVSVQENGAQSYRLGIAHASCFG